MPTSLNIHDTEVIVFTFEEALEHGHSRHHIANMLASNTWRRLRKGVYATVPDIRMFPEDEHLVQVAGVLLNAGPGWHASSWSALVAHRLPIVEFPLRRVHLTRHAATTTWRRDATVIRVERPLSSAHGSPSAPSHLAPTSGIPTVGVCEALCEFARATTLVSSVAAADAALHRNLVTRDELIDTAVVPNFRGAARARAMAKFADARVESPGESRLRVIAREMGLVAIPQFSIYDVEGPEIYRADLYVGLPNSTAEPGPGSHGLLLEYDGRAKFDASSRSNPAWTEFDRQNSRDRGLTARGYRVMHVTSRDLANPALLKTQIWERFRSPV